MKKYLIILLLPLLVFTISCEDDNDSSTSNPLVGVWEMTSVVITIQSNPIQSVTYIANDSTNDITLILGADGTYSTTGQLNGSNNTFGGTWSSTGNKITIFETSPETLTEIYDYILSGNNLKMTITQPETAEAWAIVGEFNYTKI